MSIRVIAGSAKGRKLKLVPGDSTRPVMDKVKEALFSILGHYVRGAAFLDLFAGTGSVGIEALSRGAARAVFLDLNKQAYATIVENVKTCQFQAQAEVRLVDALEYLKQVPHTAYDYIYIAPPQYQGLWQSALERLDAHADWLQPDGILIVQIDPKERLPIALKRLQPYDERMYGKTLLWFFERSDQPKTTSDSAEEGR